MASLYELECEEGEFSLAPSTPVVKGYQFEPRMNQQALLSDDSTSDDSSSDESDHEDDPRIGNTEWCKCGGCVSMPSSAENTCCTEVVPVNALREDLSLKCITQHPGFQGNCINTYVVETSFYEFLDSYGHVGDDEPIHELYRHVAYRRFTRWVWHILGKGVRKVIPSCAVHQIRENWPSDGYKGFVYKRS